MESSERESEFNLKFILAGIDLDPDHISRILDLEPTYVIFKEPRNKLTGEMTRWIFEPDPEHKKELEMQLEILQDVFSEKVPVINGIDSIELIQVSLVVYQEHYNCSFMITADQIGFLDSLDANVVIDVYVLGESDRS